MDTLVITINSDGGSVEESLKLYEQILQANKDGRAVIINVDSPGGTCGMMGNGYNINKPAKQEAKVVNFSEHNQQRKFIKFIVENSKSF